MINGQCFLQKVTPYWIPAWRSAIDEIPFSHLKRSRFQPCSWRPPNATHFGCLPHLTYPFKVMEYSTNELTSLIRCVWFGRHPKWVLLGALQEQGWESVFLSINYWSIPSSPSSIMSMQECELDITVKTLGHSVPKCNTIRAGFTFYCVKAEGKFWAPLPY